MVGIIVLNADVVQDDIDKAYGFLVVTPEFLREIASVSPETAQPILFGLQLRHGNQDVVRVEKQRTDILPPGSTYEFHIPSRVVSAVELSVKPESVALGAFGALAALVALVLSAQAISRQLRVGDDDRRVMRALGASPAVSMGEGFIGVLIAVVLGSLLAAGVAVVLSPLAPLGPVRPVYPDGGISFDWTVLGLGVAGLLVGLGAAALVMSVRGAPNRADTRRRVPARTSSIARAGAATGMPVAGVVGLLFALESPRGRTAVPVRSALLGTVVAVVMVVATLTFASGLNTLVSHPSLYGWNWTYILNPSDDVPPQTVAALDHDPDVAAWAGANLANAQIDGQSFPILLSSIKAELSPPILSGHGLNSEGQIVLGAATMAVLHKQVGDTVLISYGTPENAPVYVPPTRLKIVGTATLPAVGYTSFIDDHTSMGTGALVPVGIEPPAFQRVLHNTDQNFNGPGMVFVRMRPGISAAAGRENMQRLARSANKLFAADPRGQGNTVAVVGVQRPAQIVNYRNVGSTPVILAVGLAAGAVVRSRPHSCGVGPPTSSRPRPAEDPRLHPPTARGSDHLAGHGGRGGWRHHRDPVGDRHRPPICGCCSLATSTRSPTPPFPVCRCWSWPSVPSSSRPSSPPFLDVERREPRPRWFFEPSETIGDEDSQTRNLNPSEVFGRPFVPVTPHAGELWQKVGRRRRATPPNRQKPQSNISHVDDALSPFSTCSQP